MNIVIEGLPATGKDTSINTLPKGKAIVLNENLIKGFNYRDATEQDYIYNDILKSSLMEHHKAKGDHIVCNRFFYSTLIYKMVNENINYSTKNFKTLYSKLFKEQKMCHPDYLLYINLPIDIILDRIKNSSRYNRELGWWNKKDFLEQMSKGYLYFLENMLDASTNLIIVNSTEECIEKLRLLIQTIDFK